MQRHRVPILVAAALFVCAAAYGQSSQAHPSYRVSTVKDFLASIGSDRTIVLAKGDYVLSAGYGFKSAFVSWNDYDDGKELAIHGAANLTIRGADGARIVSDSATAYILGIYGGRNVTIDNLAIVRRPAEDAEISGGTLYAESTRGFFVDRSELSGATTNGVELSKVQDARITRTSIQECSSSALSATSCDGIEVSACAIAKNDGYPLFYFEDSDNVSVKNDKIQDNGGGNLVEIYAGSGAAESIVFDGCDFARDKVDHFAGTNLLPATVGCTFEDSSFGEGWATNSVGSSSDESYSDEDSGPASYDHYGSGLSFDYPQDWQMQENATTGRVGLFSPDGETVVMFATVYPLPAGADPAKAEQKLFSDGAVALAKLLKDEVGVVARLGAKAQGFDAGGFEAQDYGGTATKADGGSAALRVRLFINKGAVHAMIAMAKDPASLDEGTEADSIFASVRLTPPEQ